MAFALSRMMLRVAGDLAHEDAVALSIMLTRTGLLLDPLDDRLRLLLADALSRDGADDVALETLAQIPSSSPFDDEARIVSIDVLARAGRTDEALTRAREIATRRGATSDDAQSYGDLLAANDRYDAAAEAYAMAIARAEGADNWVLYVSRGRALDAAGHWDEALTALRQAVALAPNRIRVNSIALGSVMSASLQSTLRENREFRDDIEKHTPLARIASATELTETAQYLASDAAGFITGQILTIDGGRTLLDPVAAPAH